MIILRQISEMFIGGPASVFTRITLIFERKTGRVSALKGDVHCMVESFSALT